MPNLKVHTLIWIFYFINYFSEIGEGAHHRSRVPRTKATLKDESATTNESNNVSDEYLFYFYDNYIFY